MNLKDQSLFKLSEHLGTEIIVEDFELDSVVMDNESRIATFSYRLGNKIYIVKIFEPDWDISGYVEVIE